MTSSGQTPEVQRCGPLALVARGVAKSFGDGAQRADILHDVNLVVPRGQTVFLVGPSGSGKTTLLSILGCLLTPNRGSLQLLGHDVTHLSADERTAFRRQHLSFVFQNFHLFPTLSALDNLCLTLTMQGLDYAAAARRAAELLERVELRHRSHLRPGQLSTGECQRVAIARALANDPAMLLADEPTASLDAEKGLLVVELLRDAMRRHGGTLLIVTHDDRIFSYADRIVRLADGAVRQDSLGPAARARIGTLAGPFSQLAPGMPLAARSSL